MGLRVRMPPVTTRSVGDLSVGDVFMHHKSGTVYEIHGFSTFSDDGNLDGHTIVHYHDHIAEYTTPLKRFVGMVETPRFKRMDA